MWQTKRHTTLVEANDVVGIVYFDFDGDLKTVIIIITPQYKPTKWSGSSANRGNKLTLGPEGVKFNALEVCSSILVSM